MASPFSVLSEVAQRVFARCQVPGCSLFSLGVVCARCSRRVCLRHGYIALSAAPPSSICAACILGDHPELLSQATFRRGKVVLEPDDIDVDVEAA